MCLRDHCTGGVRISPSAEVLREERDEPLAADGSDPAASDMFEPLPAVLRPLPGLFAAGSWLHLSPVYPTRCSYVKVIYYEVVVRLLHDLSGFVCVSVSVSLCMCVYVCV